MFETNKELRKCNKYYTEQKCISIFKRVNQQKKKSKV